MSKNHRAGKKFCGKHTTLSPATGKMVDYITKKCNNIKISLGTLKCGLRPSKGRRWVKVQRLSGCLLLKIRDNISVQTISIYANNQKNVLSALYEAAKKHNFAVTVQ